MTAALATALMLSVLGLIGAFVFGYRAESGADILQHSTFATFVTVVVLLAHSMSMFFLIGKGRAVKDAVREYKISGNHVVAVSTLRRPVFSQATLAMLITMVTAILGGGVDTGVFPPVVHGLLAGLAVASNVVAVRTELTAFAGVARIVSTLDREIVGTAGDAGGQVTKIEK
jgi:hypothetical protein